MSSALLGATAKTVLIADDDSFVQLTIKRCLEQAGYKVWLASNGQQVLDSLRKQEVGVVLLDIFMPTKDGLESLLEIKKEFPNQRVVVMSGGGTTSRHDFLSIASKFGADCVLKKPASIRELIDAIEVNTLQSQAS